MLLGADAEKLERGDRSEEDEDSGVMGGGVGVAADEDKREEGIKEEACGGGFDG